jgi:hypothetical protein
VGKDTAWANTIKMALGTVAGVRVNPGSITGIVVGADNVVSLNKPFVCLVETRRVGAHYNASGVPDIVYVKRDEWGREHYETSSFGPAVRLSAALANAIENSAVYVKRLSMESIDGKKYKISTMNKVKNYSETVEQ